MNEQIEKTLNRLYQNKDKTIMVHELYDEPIFYSNAIRTLDNVLYEEGLITVDNEARRLTSLGLKICAKGGWVKHLESQDQVNQEQVELNKLQLKSLKSSITVNKWNKIFLVVNAVLVILNIVLMILIANGTIKA